MEATVLGPMKNDKVIVFKKKKRKVVSSQTGHRQGYTEIQMTKIDK